MILFRAIFGLCFLMGIGLGLGGCQSEPVNVAEAEAVEEDSSDKTSFEEVVKDCNAIEGFFTFYHNESEGDYFLKIKPDQFDTTFLCSITREAGDGTYFDSASMLTSFPFEFKRVGNKVLFIQKNLRVRVTGDSGLQKAVSRGISDSIMGMAEIKGAADPNDGGVAVDPTGFFIQDIGMVSQSLKEHRGGLAYSFDAATSYFKAVKSFPKNSEVQVSLNFKSSELRSSPTQVDSRSFQHVYHYSLLSLPDSNYMPRLADDRVGHFLTMYQDYTNVEQDSAYRRYINRWQLEKSDPTAEPSSPKQPIVYWLENTIPLAYRDAIREGVLLWNSAFEQAGFTDAIVVKQQPDDAEWDPADARYTTIRWIIQPQQRYAVGPSWADPFTGQLYDADIRISADFVRFISRQFEEFTDPLEIANTHSPLPSPFDNMNPYLCDYAQGAAQDATFGWNLLQSRGELGAMTDAESKKYVHDFLVQLTAHEVGHTLGLRHNFKASTIRSEAELADNDVIKQAGLTGSVMDYIPINIFPDDIEQDYYFQATLGPYDYWAIEYAYKPIDATSPDEELEALGRIAGRSSEPQLTYGTDEDAFEDGRGIDPFASRYDLGDDPLVFYRSRLALVRELWGKLESEFEKPGMRYTKLRQVFNTSLYTYPKIIDNAAKYIGGMSHRRDHVGDSGGRVPFEPIVAEQQRQALALFNDVIFSPDAFAISPTLLNKLAPERFWDFSGRMWSTKRIDYPLHELVLTFQKRALNRLYNPTRLSRLLDMPLRTDRPEDAFTMAELFNRLLDSIWGELDDPENINSFRRGLQRAHLNKLIGLVVKPAPDFPEDATTLARANLVVLKKKIQAMIATVTLDDTTQSHLAESMARIESALQAGLDRHLN